MPKRFLPVMTAGLLALTACGGTGPLTPTTPAPLPSTGILAAQALATPIALSAGQTRQVNVTVSGQPAQPGQLLWTSSNAAVATVTQGGLITARAAGSATVRAALSAAPSSFLDFPVTVTAAKTAPAPAPAPSTYGQRVLDLTNAARAQARSCGATSFAAAAPLTYSMALEQAAQGHAGDMAAKNYFSHTSLDGRSMADRINATGYRWRTIGENIAAGQRTPEEVVQGWLSSEGHCRNIMNPAFRELGVGYAQGGSYGQYWVQNFAAPS